MLIVKTKLKYSEIHGLGCFAAEDIKKGQTVWRFDQGIDLTFSENDLKQLPTSFVEFLKTYAYSPLNYNCNNNDNDKKYILCADNARHMNHSDDPNLDETPDGLNIALRNIKIGEELTCNYNQFDKDAAFKLGKLK
jgi:SET domain-containing protein